MLAAAYHEHGASALIAVAEYNQSGAYKYGQMPDFELELRILKKYGVEFQQ